MTEKFNCLKRLMGVNPCQEEADEPRVSGWLRDEDPFVKRTEATKNPCDLGGEKGLCLDASANGHKRFILATIQFLRPKCHF
jgi:hypothetical protein